MPLSGGLGVGAVLCVGEPEHDDASSRGYRESISVSV